MVSFLDLLALMLNLASYANYGGVPVRGEYCHESVSDCFNMASNLMPFRPCDLF